MRYEINVEESILGTRIEMTSERDVEYVIRVINQSLSESQIKALIKSAVEIVEGVILS